MSDRKLLACTLLLFVLSFVVYVNFFDILIPGLPEGSYRLAVGSLFVIPSFLLAGGQVLIGGLIIYFGSNSLKTRSVSRSSRKTKFQKSLFIAAAITFFFSLTYVIFPFYGPFYYIVFVFGNPHALLVEVVWSAIMLVAGTLLVEKFNKVGRKHAFLVAAIAIVFITVAAS